jgi:isocitrate lyase
MMLESRLIGISPNDFYEVSEMTARAQAATPLAKEWAENPRWKGIRRDYTAADVIRLRGSLHIEQIGRAHV